MAIRDSRSVPRNPKSIKYFVVSMFEDTLSKHSCKIQDLFLILLCKSFILKQVLFNKYLILFSHQIIIDCRFCYGFRSPLLLINQICIEFVRFGQL